MQYCIYLRKSRADIEAESRGEGETLERHKKALLELAKKQKLNITKIHHEIVSGETISSRPVMQQLLSEVEQGMWDGVLVMEVERLARGDTVDQGTVAQTFKYSNTKIITPMKTYDPNNEYDEEYFEFGLFMSRREYKTINRRLQQGRIASVKEGKYLGTIAPYGYNRKKLEKQKGYTLEINPEQAEIVKLIFELYTKGEYQEDSSLKRLGVSLIVRKLNELRIPPMKGDVWVTATIQGMLRNPVYIGMIRWNSRPTKKKMIDGVMKKERPRAKDKDWILVEGLHEAIIDKETFELAQEYLSKNPAAPVPTRHIIKNPLSGLIVCGVCGRKMVRRPYGSKQPETIMCPVTSCNNVSSYLSFVEEKLLLALEKWLESYKLDMKSDKTIDSSSSLQMNTKIKAIEKLDSEIATLEKQLDNLHDLLEQGIYSIDKFLERSKLLSEKIQKSKDDKCTLEESIEREQVREENKKSIVPKIEKILEVYNSIEDVSIKNKLLKEVLEKAVYKKTSGGRWHSNPDDFELEIFPKMPR